MRQFMRNEVSSSSLSACRSAAVMTPPDVKTTTRPGVGDFAQALHAALRRILPRTPGPATSVRTVRGPRCDDFFEEALEVLAIGKQLALIHGKIRLLLRHQRQVGADHLVRVVLIERGALVDWNFARPSACRTCFAQCGADAPSHRSMRRRSPASAPANGRRGSVPWPLADLDSTSYCARERRLAMRTSTNVVMDHSHQ